MSENEQELARLRKHYAELEKNELEIFNHINAMRRALRVMVKERKKVAAAIDNLRSKEVTQ